MTRRTHVVGRDLARAWRDTVRRIDRQMWESFEARLRLLYGYTEEDLAALLWRHDSVFVAEVRQLAVQLKANSLRNHRDEAQRDFWRKGRRAEKRAANDLGVKYGTFLQVQKRHKPYRPSYSY